MKKTFLAALLLLGLPLLLAQVTVRPGEVAVRPMSDATSNVLTRPVTPGGVGPSSLLTGLVSYWPLASNGTDTLGLNNLTPAAGVTFLPVGPSGTVADFEDTNNERLDLSLAVGADVDIMACMWAQQESQSGSNELFVTGTNGNFNMRGGGNSYVTYVKAFAVNATTAAINTVGAWNFVCGWYDTVNDLVGVAINGIETTTAAAGPNGGGTGIVSIGARNATAATYFDGRLARAGYWNNSMSAGTRTALIASLYNGGRGKLYSDLTTTDKVGLVSYWNLTEGYGNRFDSHGSNTMTDIATVAAMGLPPSQVVAKFVAANLEYLSVPTPTSLKEQHTRSYSTWFRTDSDIVVARGIMSCGGPGVAPVTGTPIFLLQDDGAGGNITVYHNGAFVLSQPRSIVPGWHNATFTYNHSTGAYVFYLDGLVVGNGAAIEGTSKDDDNLYVGSGYPSYNDDLIGPTAVWAGVVAPAEVTSLYNYGVPKLYSSLTAAEKVNLVSYWNLTETSGNRADSHGSNTLIDTNTVMSAYAGGPPANMQGTTAGTQPTSTRNLTKASFTAPATYTIAGWAQTDVIGTAGIFGAIGTWANSVQFTVYESGSNVLSHLVGDSATFKTALSTMPAVSGSMDWTSVGWFFFIATFDNADKTPHIYVNYEAVDTNVVGTALPGTPYRTAATLKVGVDGGPLLHNGRTSNLMLFSRVVTPAERACLWNSGRGAVYPFTGLCVP